MNKTSQPTFETNNFPNINKTNTIPLNNLQPTHKTIKFRLSLIKGFQSNNSNIKNQNLNSFAKNEISNISNKLKFNKSPFMTYSTINTSNNSKSTAESKNESNNSSHDCKIFVDDININKIDPTLKKIIPLENINIVSNTNEILSNPTVTTTDNPLIKPNFENDGKIQEKKKIKKRFKEIRMKYKKLHREGSYNCGRWQPEEHERFIEAIMKFGNEWKQVQKYVGSRSSTQARSHAQKFFVKMKRANVLDINVDLSRNSIKNLHDMANSMNCDQYLNAIKALNNVAFERKSHSSKSKNKKEDKIIFDSNLNLSEDCEAKMNLMYN